MDVKRTDLELVVSATLTAGLLLYLLGVAEGFFQASAAVLGYRGTLEFTPASVLLLESYPRHLITVLPLPLIIEEFSPVTIVCIVCAASAVASGVIGEPRGVLASSSSALLALILQYILALQLVGGEPFGPTLRAFFALPAFPVPFLVVVSHKNLYPLILPASLFGAGMTVTLAHMLREKMRGISETPPNRESLEALKSIRITGRTLLPPLLLFGLAGFLYVQIFRVEFPHYPILYIHTPLNLFNSTFFAVLWIYLILSWKAYLAARDHLAEKCVPLLARELRMRKPVIPLAEVEKIFGVGKTERQQLVDVLSKASKAANERGAIYFRVFRKHLYLEEPIARTVKRKLKERGEVDIDEVAKELQTETKLLRSICHQLKRQELLGSVRIHRNKIKPLGNITPQQSP
ncbi:MAG: hypothetical protein ACTSUQ_11785 [Candidatus Freyarchaeota archaeon]